MIKCWYCQVETEIKETDYGDHRCNHCQVQISVYQPPQAKVNPPETTENEWLTKPEE